jgi:hypothetical protein
MAWCSIAAGEFRIPIITSRRSCRVALGTAISRNLEDYRYLHVTIYSIWEASWLGRTPDGRPPGWAEHPLRTGGYSSGALRAVGALRRQRHNRTVMRFSRAARSTSRTSDGQLPAVLRPKAAFGRSTGEAPRRRLRRLCHFDQHASPPPFCGEPCASACEDSSQRCCGLRPPAAPLAARPPATPAPPAPLSAALGRHAALPNPASLAGEDASAARYTPQRTRASNDPLSAFKMILKASIHPSFKKTPSLPKKGARERPPIL